MSPVAGPGPGTLRGPVFTTPGHGPDLAPPPGPVIGGAGPTAPVASPATPVANLWRQPVYGCAVTASGMTVSVAQGIVAYDAGFVTVAAASGLTIAAADPVLDRYDAIAVDGTGTVSVITGTAGQAFTPLTNPAHFVLAVVYIPAGATSVTVQDTRVNPQQIPQITTDPHLMPAQTFAFTFLNTAQSNADPGANNCGFDSTINLSIAHLYVNYTQPIGLGTGAAVKTWFQGGPSGALIPYYLRLWSRKDSTQWWFGQVTGFTDHGTYCDLQIAFVAQSGSTNGPTELSTDALDTLMSFQGLVPAAAPAAPTTSNGEAALANDVTGISTSGFSDGPNTGSIGASGQTLLLIAQALFSSTSAAARNITVRLWDGNTVFAETEIQLAAVNPTYGEAYLVAIVNPSAAATYKISAEASGTLCNMKKQAVDNSGAAKATKISWARLA